MVALALFSLVSVLASPAFAHLYITEPKPNQFEANEGTYKGPTEADGSNFPCKGFVDGPSSASWAAGSQQKTVVFGSAVHGGGSCQVSLSYDKGKTFKVMKTWIGECPIAAEGNLDEGSPANMALDFTVPADAPAGEALFSWSWMNRVGNREFYQNCATVTISGTAAPGNAAFSALPDMFVANIPQGNGCGTAEGAAVDIPNPGKDVVRAPNANVLPPTGNCAAPAPLAQPETPAPAPGGAAPDAAAPGAAAPGAPAPGAPAPGAAAPVAPAPGAPAPGAPAQAPPGAPVAGVEQANNEATSGGGADAAPVAPAPGVPAHCPRRKRRRSVTISREA